MKHIKKLRALLSEAVDLTPNRVISEEEKTAKAGLNVLLDLFEQQIISFEQLEHQSTGYMASMKKIYKKNSP